MNTLTPHQMRTDDFALILAAEECQPDAFDEIHKFSDHDRRLIRKLVAHGPVLLQGGRGTGKSAFMIAASREMAPHNPDSSVLGLYISLRYVPLLQATGQDYEMQFCTWVSRQIQKTLAGQSYNFEDSKDIRLLKNNLTELTKTTNKRVVLLFDDAAHIGRETSLASFFDIFRTLSSETISCKAAIYPGVTEFGTRFDVYNDASVIDVVRSPEQAGFTQLFYNIMTSRYPVLTNERVTGFTLHSLAGFLGRTVLGNVRGFVFACNDLLERAESGDTIGYNLLGDTLIRLAADYYWPLLDEVKPKLGRYVPAVDAAQQVAEVIFQACASNTSQSVLIHRQIVARYSKSFEILEYAGFIARREASRALKSGGRGPRFSINLCNLLERISGSRLTSSLFDSWSEGSGAPTEIHERGVLFDAIDIPHPNDSEDMEILGMQIDILEKSKSYPYGLTRNKINSLKEANIITVGDLANSSDESLLAIDGVGDVFLDRFRSVVGQAIWM
ncbi:MAG TPA: hypothetical protein VMV35_05955 [Halothiobacillus sp.]|nr:hypothetical protein [Halothiobacillus sp.]